MHCAHTFGRPSCLLGKPFLICSCLLELPLIKGIPLQPRSQNHPPEKGSSFLLGWSQVPHHSLGESNTQASSQTARRPPREKLTRGRRVAVPAMPTVMPRTSCQKNMAWRRRKSWTPSSQAPAKSFTFLWVKWNLPNTRKLKGSMTRNKMGP